MIICVVYWEGPAIIGFGIRVLVVFGVATAFGVGATLFVVATRDDRKVGQYIGLGIVASALISMIFFGVYQPL